PMAPPARPAAKPPIEEAPADVVIWDAAIEEGFATLAAAGFFATLWALFGAAFLAAGFLALLAFFAAIFFAGFFAAFLAGFFALAFAFFLAILQSPSVEMFIGTKP